jgi:hypothetical protein
LLPTTWPLIKLLQFVQSRYLAIKIFGRSCVTNPPVKYRLFRENEFN